MKNRILKALSTKEYRLIAPQMRPVDLVQGTVLYEAGGQISDIYFPDDAVVSYFSGTAEGETLELCVIGNEGVVGIASVLGNAAVFQAVVQLPGRAYSMKRDSLRKEFRRCDTLHRVLLQYTNALIVQISQTAVCNKFHSVEKRFCRCLLMAHDRADSDSLALTQDAFARILGSRRASVSVVASSLQKKGAIRYSRGVIQVLDRKPIENGSCECYETISAAHAKANP